ncbi:MAG TPA: beta-ketoacyl synthase N-terminal-like domain-containing protein [Ktedonobacteraceae bacterium]|jgi:acyl transferase domain-containing protein/acyl-CoA synthetase (AMP-forming)/AMP-acid ligase II/acyl carrier protein|nr:beta-ketoacyl synthase N-terminal-like domain-containing protein [Ktedonobacteraceae bacterium]
MNIIAQESQPPGATFVELLRQRAFHHPDQNAYTFLLDGETQETRFSYAELDDQARRIAVLLQDSVAPGARALLLYQPGLEYIAAVFGCWYAGVVAVPAYPPRLNNNMTRIESIIHDAEATVALTTSTILTSLHRKFSDDPLLQNLSWIETNTATAEVAQSWREWHGEKEHLALLQYTSGSTGMPKGVMLTHGNLLHNARFIQESVELNAETRIGCWLPPYHDMGLMGGILEAVYVGTPAFLMAPAAFLQQPLRWLRMISRYGIGGSCAPNFAYDLCVSKATPEQLAGLDLSRWRVVMTGAEPVRAETLARFVETFAPYGFNKEAFYPCYGLAEATLFVSGGLLGTAPQVQTFDASALEAGNIVEMTASHEQARSFVGCGYAREGQQIIIVDPERQMLCVPDQVGEIWVAAPNVAQGYWGKAEETQQTFQAYLQGSGEGPFLRTGDLGFFWQGELFVTGRLKDVIIIRGRNLYPQDIEQVVEKSHPALRQSCCAAFAVSGDDTERLVIVQEVERHYNKWDVRDIVSSICQAVGMAFDVDVAAVELLRAGTIYKTSSGKLQHHACRQGFRDGKLQAVYRWHQERHDDVQMQGETLVSGAPASQAERQETNGKIRDISSWLVTHIAERAHLDPRTVDLHAPFVQYGFNSLEAVGLSGELEHWLGRSLSPTLVYDYPSISLLAHYLAQGEQPVKTAIQAADAASQHPQPSGAIAVIGMACRFPGASTPEEFWQFLSAHGNGISEVTHERWDTQAWYDPQAGTPGKMSTRWGGFLSDIDQFDAGFFKISAREASYIDPQQRLLLEVAWEAFEQANIVPAQFAGSQTGVFVGVSSSDYYVLHHAHPDYHQAYAGTGNAHSIAANRLSYYFDFHGPSVAVDTACSSSLFAVHQACQSLRSGECSLALAGGVNVMLTPELTVTFSQAHMMAADGRCKTFDASSDGYVRSEGCGIILLKRLEDAQHDGDQVLAVIRGSAVNQDGASNGLTAPNGRAQEAVIRQALSNADVRPDQIGYVETHGTGTPLGDPIEVQALKAVLMPRSIPAQTCVLGAVKTNIGHLEAAAGIASIIKAVLSLQHGVIPPNLHFSSLNPHIELDGTTFVLPTREQQWPALYQRRIAGVSAFGFGGTNVHVVLEAPPAHQQPTRPFDHIARPLHILTLSARSDIALQQLAQRYQRWLALHPEVSIADLCLTANTGRTHFSQRLALLADSTQQLQTRLSDFTRSHDTMGSQGDAAMQGKIVFLFTGQGAQYVGMARQLYETQPVFRRELEHCAQFLSPYLEQPLLSLLYPVGEHISPLNETAFAQPALFALEYALAALWRSWGVEPDIVIGHSVGEYVAACIADMMSLEEGLKLIALRGRLMQSLPVRGAMVTVFSSYAQVAQLLEPWRTQLSVAAVNGPEHVVVAGAEDVLQVFVRQLEERTIDSRPLKVSHAFHSPLLEPMLDSFERAAQQVQWQPASVPLICNLNGQFCPTGTTLDAAYWRRQTRESVQYAGSIQTAYEQGGQIFIEIGPHDTLLRLGQQCISDQTLYWLPSLQRRSEDTQTIFSSLMTLYTHGGKIDWYGFEQQSVCSHLSLPALPTYPFEQKRYWFTSAIPAIAAPYGYKNVTPSRLAQAMPPAEQVTMFPELQQSVSTDAAIDLERVFAQQLDILHQQLDILHTYVAGASDPDPLL